MREWLREWEGSISSFESPEPPLLFVPAPCLYNTYKLTEFTKWNLLVYLKYVEAKPKKASLCLSRLSSWYADKIIYQIFTRLCKYKKRKQILGVEIKISIYRLLNVEICTYVHLSNPNFWPRWIFASEKAGAKKVGWITDLSNSSYIIHIVLVSWRKWNLHISRKSKDYSVDGRWFARKIARLRNELTS